MTELSEAQEKAVKLVWSTAEKMIEEIISRKDLKDCDEFTTYFHLDLTAEILDDKTFCRDKWGTKHPVLRTTKLFKQGYLR